MEDVLLAHQRAVEAHSKYIRSSFRNLDPRFRDALQPLLADDRLQPPPWLQVEPSFEPAGTVAQWAARGLAHPALDALLQGRPLHRHELQALQRAAAGQDVACATAVGLAAAAPGLVAVLNALLGEAATPGPRALIVCPTDDALHAHTQALHGCERNHVQATGLRFPASFAVLDAGMCLEGEPPPLLLASAAALERVLLGLAGHSLRSRLLAHLRWLLTPDFHAWRGRAGADAALLLRRQQAQCANRLTCIATCAPWPPQAHAGDLTAEIAKAAAALLGRSFAAAQVVPETFVRATTAQHELATGAALHAAIAAGMPAGDRLDELLAHPCVQWLERRVALQGDCTRLERAPARPWSDVVRQLAEDACVGTDSAEQALCALLRWIGRVNAARQADPALPPVLPFRLHQALVRPGALHATLDQDGHRVVTPWPGGVARDGATPLFPLAFSRGGGLAFYCVSRVGERLLPRLFDTAGEGEDGYLIAGDGAWQPGAAPDFLPAEWLNRERSAAHWRLRASFPRRVHFDASGRCSDAGPLAWQGWFMRAPLLFDPAARTCFHPATPEADKLDAGGPQGQAPCTGLDTHGALVLFECDGAGAADEAPGATPVRAPRMQLLAPDLLRSHLQALALSEAHLPGLDKAPTALVDEAQRGLPLRAEVLDALRLDAAARGRVGASFQRMLFDLQSMLPAHAPWLTASWMAETLDTLARRLDASLQPWRVLFCSARADLERATQGLEGGLLCRGGAAYRRQQRLCEQSQRRLALLRHEVPGGLDACRVLAERGFLPAHHLARRPLRLFVPAPGGQGDFIARPRAEALHAFAPRQRLRLHGRDYRVRRTLLPNAAAALTQAKLARRSGAWLAGAQAQAELCPLSGHALSEDACERLGDLLEMGDGIAEEATASCTDDGPLARALQVSTWLAASDDAGPVHDLQATLSAGAQPLLDVRHLPAARIVRLACRERGAPDDGFTLDLVSGEWRAAMPARDALRPAAQRRVRPWTAHEAAAVLFTPAPALGLQGAALAALPRLLARAAERQLGLHPGELDAVLLGEALDGDRDQDQDQDQDQGQGEGEGEGEGGSPSLLLYEAGEGGLGVLRGLLQAPHALPAVLAQARALCRRGDPAPLPAALERLAAGTLVLRAPAAGEDYEARYARLLRALAPQAEAARRFLQHLHAHGLRLPDDAGRRVDGLYLRPDFLYAPRCWVFCDEALGVQEAAAGRDALRDRGDEVWAWQAAEDLPARLAQRPDLFGRVR